MFMMSSGDPRSLERVTLAWPLPFARGLSTRRFVLAVCAVVVVLRTVYLVGPFYSDEAGYTVVARSLRAGGPNLYGHYFVDRPPGLLLLYRLATLTGWAPSIRVLATGLALLLVGSAAWAAYEAVGERGVRWAAVVAAALVVTPVLSAQEADGEILAAPLVMLSLALTLAAVRRSGWPACALATGAGLAAGTAVMVKQNFGDGVVFALVLLLASLVQRRTGRRDAAVVAAGGVLGGAVVAAAALGFVVWSRVGLRTAWTTVFGFRGTALDVIADHSLHAPVMRAFDLAGRAVLAGVLPLLVLLLAEAVRCRFRGPPVAWALGATALLDVVSIAMGGSYWPHYLLQLVPVLALAAGLWAADAGRLRAAVAATVASAVAAIVVVTLTGAAYPRDSQRVGAFLARSSRPGDTATVLYGNAEVQQASGMRSPYPHLWSLPMRTLDPHLTRLRAVLTGPRAPTWVVDLGHLDAWNIDAHDRTRLALATHYREVAAVCGHTVFLHDGVRRTLASPRCR
jgi:Glycosyltransferase family 87